MGSVPYLALGDPPKYSGDEKRHAGFGIGFSKRRETVKSRDGFDGRDDAGYKAL